MKNHVEITSGEAKSLAAAIGVFRTRFPTTDTWTVSIGPVEYDPDSYDFFRRLTINGTDVYEVVREDREDRGT